jgi:pyridoxamine 5'-phosphate oxidase
VTDFNQRPPATPAPLWLELDRAAGDPRHPWRTPALATADGSVRTVVLRSVEASRRELVFHTDLRSPKISAIAASPRVEWLFYHPGDGVQVRALADATVHADNPIAEKTWRNVPPANRGNYQTVQPPGTPLRSTDEDLAPSPDTPDDGYRNFAVITTRVSRFDWLLLAPTGNLRSRFDFNATADDWSATPLTP